MPPVLNIMPLSFGAAPGALSVRLSFFGTLARSAYRQCCIPACITANAQDWGRWQALYF